MVRSSVIEKIKLLALKMVLETRKGGGFSPLLVVADSLGSSRGLHW
jgi:hypothetical protein